MADPEFIVVGSGAGGGTVAARLAEEGRTVLLLEAGGDPKKLEGGNAIHPALNCLPDDYDVPAFHAASTENEAMAWDFFVRHYANDEQQKKDDKFVPERDGVLYPRAGTLGGCTAHNAMIFVYPCNSDWEYIEQLTGDSSWSPKSMKRILRKLEDCQHELGFDLGQRGWLCTEKAAPLQALLDGKLDRLLVHAVLKSLKPSQHGFATLHALLDGHGNPNDWDTIDNKRAGLAYTPLTTRGHKRVGTRERLREVETAHPGKLTIELNAHVTKVLLSDDGTRAIGVEYRKGEKLYRAFKKPMAGAGALHQAVATREVILAGGAFNTPQLLMLSGIGPEADLKRVGIEPKVKLAGVGKNLQDRYEVGLVFRMKKDWDVLEGAEFRSGDRWHTKWKKDGGGVYGTNGAVLASIRRSFETRPTPDLFCFALLGDFKGYKPGYSKPLATEHDRLTWAVLKGHTENRAGEVKLKTADPLDMPNINFRYFEEGSDAAGDDLKSVVEGVKYVRGLVANLSGIIQAEDAPSVDYKSDEEIAEFVRNYAWGHHASCTCPIGDPKKGGVLDSRFQVHGVKGLRVVDASAFPRIPGLFIVSAVYMIGEKAAEAILQDNP